MVLKDEAVIQPVGTVMLKGIQLAKKQMKKCKEHQQYISDRRDVSTVCNEVVESLAEFMN